MKPTTRLAIAALALAAGLVVPAAWAVDGQIMILTGENYTKWLWGTQRTDGSLYNFTTIPNEGYGDNGQGTEINFLIASKPSKYVEVTGRIQSRFSQNQWTNFGGFGGRNPAFEEPPGGPCVGGDCGEFDPRSNEYIKLRGLTARFTPGYKLLDVATVGSTDLGSFDPFTIGKVRYIDRDNAKAIHFQGSVFQRKLAWDLIRVSLPRLWAGPNFVTGDYTAADGAYGLQLRYTGSSLFDLTLLHERVRDIEVDGFDRDFDDGFDVAERFQNDVTSVRFGIHPGSTVDFRGAAYFSEAESDPRFGAPATFFSLSGFSPVPAGDLEDEAYKANVDFNLPGGLSVNLEYFDLGAQYVSMLAARREVDILLTEGHDGAFAFPGPDNSAFGVFAGNPTRIGFGGWQGTAQQVATINVDNEFTDFEEPMAETAIGWKGITVVPNWSLGNVDLSGEYSKIDYNTNWQAWGDASRPIDQSIYPNHESDAGVGSFRNAYAPFQDKETDILVLKAKTLLSAGNGVELWGKLKWIDETDERMADARFLPFRPGDCPGGGVPCAGNVNAYNAAGSSTAAIYGNPPVITVGNVTGYQWKPFDSLSDDDRDMSYFMFQLGAGYQFSGDFYGSLTFERYDVELQDGNTAFQAYQLHNLASGQHDKNKLMLYARYTLGGAEFGFHYEYNWGEFDPDFGGGFVTQFADADTANNFGVPVGSPGFRGRFGGWNTLLTRDFEQQRLKTFMKVRF